MVLTVLSYDVYRICKEIRPGIARPDLKFKYSEENRKGGALLAHVHLSGHFGGEVLFLLLDALALHEANNFTEPPRALAALAMYFSTVMELSLTNSC